MKFRYIVFFFVSLFLVNCGSQKEIKQDAKIVYESDDLIITQISENVFEHTSFLNTESFGRVSCNGMIVKDHGEAVIFDTTTDNKSSEELIRWVNTQLHCKINAVVPTHFHDDNLGGLKVFHEYDIASYANDRTIELAKNSGAEIPKNDFQEEINLKVGHKKAMVRFFGEGHTKDNVVGYFPSEKALFGGCLIKEMDATKGYLGDANVSAWSETVENVKAAYPDVKIVIPGHGKYGDSQLYDYTIKLFKIQ